MEKAKVGVKSEEQIGNYCVASSLLHIFDSKISSSVNMLSSFLAPILAAKSVSAVFKGQ